MSDKRQRYEALRLAQCAIIDAITAARHIAARASDCFEGSDDFGVFNRMRSAIGDLAKGPEMRDIISTVMAARSEL